MADKRMFTKEIVESDDFLDMPYSARCLYFHINLNADDDGFLNSPNKVMRISDATKDDLNLLIEKRFILSFPGGVICVKHWLMHNTLKKDRYKGTKYQEFLSTLEVKENGAYTEKAKQTEAETERFQNGIETETERKHSIVKDSIVKDSIDKERIEKDGQQIVDLFHSLCPSFNQVKYLSEKTKANIAESLSFFTLDDFKTLFIKAEASAFLKGENEKKWSATFDWLIKAENITKVLNGNYDTKKTARQAELEAWERMQQQKMMEEAETIIDNPELKARAEALQAEFEKE